MVTERGESAKSPRAGNDVEAKSGTLREEVTVGRLEGLRALRDTLAAEIEAGPQGEKAVSQTAALARQLREVLRDIAELEKAIPQGSVVDDLASKRERRRLPASADSDVPDREDGKRGTGSG